MWAGMYTNAPQSRAIAPSTMEMVLLAGKFLFPNESFRFFRLIEGAMVCAFGMVMVCPFDLRYTALGRERVCWFWVLENGVRHP